MNDLESEITQLESMLAEIPQDNLINRIGLENRLAGVKSTLLDKLREENARLKNEVSYLDNVLSAREKENAKLKARIKWLREKPKDNALVARADMVKLLSLDWAETHTAVQKLCLGNGLSKDEVEGDSYGVPDITNLVEMLVEKLKVDRAKRDCDDGATHNPDCYDYGRRHYNCALQKIKELEAELVECKRVIVQVAIPLESMVCAGTHTLQSEAIANEIMSATMLIRRTMSKGGEG